MKRNKITITIICYAVFFLIAALILLPAAQAGEKTEKFKGRHVTQISKIDVVKVDDVEGHVIGILQRRGLDFKNGEIGIYRNWAYFDVIKGKGTATGYSQVTYEDGSTTFATVQGTLEPLEGKRATGKGTFTFVRGSGRFEGIKGGGTWTFKTFTPYTVDETKSDAIVEYQGTRTLPSK
jgi:hypothetical protein